MKLQQLSIPEPSKLYSLKPQGIGTSGVESLASYTMRLAEAHCLNICDLIHRFVYPLIGKEWKDVHATNRINKVYKVHRHNVTPAHLHFGKWLHMTEETQATITALSELTKRQDLHLLTLLPLKGHIYKDVALRHQRVWCPCCYQEQEDSGRPIHDLLLWSFMDVVVCPTHEQFLLSACHWCGAKQYLLSYSSQPGYCSKCGLWLGKSEIHPSRGSHYDLWRAQVLGDLVARLKHLPQKSSRKPPTLQKLLSEYYRGHGKMKDLLVLQH